MYKRSNWRNLAAIAVLATAVSAAHAVDVNGRIKGTVTDPTGAVVAGASVTATNQDTGVKFTTKSQANGDYTFQQLPVGTYTVTATSNGFKTFSASGITIAIAQEYVEKVVLTTGAASDQVDVQADAVQVNTTDMQLNNVVNSAQILELPLIGRNFTTLELIQPGVQAPDTRFGGTFSVSGAQAQQSSYLINGADTNDIALNTIAIVPNLDAIEQFNLIEGPLNAEYDRNSGGIVSATIVQGTNHFHGDVFEFYRDTFLNTNNFFQKTYSPTGVRTDTVSPYHQNIFGGTIGGPIYRDKIFFFGAYQGTRQRVPEGTYQSVIPTTANIAGNFSADVASGAFAMSTGVIPASINIPGCATGQTWASCLIPKGGILPATTFNAISTKLAATYIPASTTGAFTYNATANTTADQYIGRIDYNLNPKNQFTAIGIYQKSILSEGIPFSGASLPGFGDGSLSHIQQWTFDYVRQLSNTTVNDLAAHYTRFNFDSGAPQQVVQPSSVGFAITPQDPTGATIPTIAVGGFTLGGTNNGPQPRIDQVIQLDDNLTKTFGHHNIKVGYDGRRFNVSNTFDASNSGSYGFSTTGTYSTGDTNLDFLLGIPATYTQGTGSVIQADAFLNYVYAQDQWQALPNLTLSYGLGYSIDTPLRNHQFGGEAVSCFNVGSNSTVFPGAPTNLLFPGDNGCKNSGQAYTRYSEFGPRIGFAFSPDLGRLTGGAGKTSIRGGFGIYYNRTEEESALQTLGTPPFGFTSGGAADFGGNASFGNPYADINNGLTTGANGAKGTASIANRFPYIEPAPGAVINFANLEPIYNISSFDKSFRAPYSENFQLSIERELPARSVLRVSYVGALGRHNQVDYEGDYVTAAGHAACAASASCIANRVLQAYYFPGHTIGNSSNLIEIGEVGSYASSNYNSLQLSLHNAPTHGLQFQISYTYAHAMDNASSFENAGFGEFGQRGYNQFNSALNYGDSTFDVRNRLVIAPIYKVPSFKGKSSFNPLNLALTGWEISAIVQLAQGQPFDISYAGGSSNSLYCSIDVSFYACPDVPNQTAPLKLTNALRTRNAKGYVQYFTNAGFAPEPIGQFGNIHRNPYHGPGINDTDMSIAKNFKIGSDGKRSVQIRMQSTNVFNHTQFASPSSTFADSTPTSTTTTFGQITSAAAARQTQLAAKIYF